MTLKIPRIDQECAGMRILFVSEHRRYKRAVQELRRRNTVDYVFMSSEWRMDNGDYHIPRLFGRHKGFKFLRFIVVNWLLFRNRYDFCVTDWLSVFVASFFLLIKSCTNLFRTKLIHDLRTIPVNYPEYRSKEVENRFSRQLRFANTYYQGISFITEEMKRYIEKQYMCISKPWCIWESGVDTLTFMPTLMNGNLKRELGFRENDFICFYHGGIGESRGIFDLVESFSIIKSKQQSIKLLLLGAGPDYVRVRELIDTHNLQGIVALHNWVENRKVPDYISIADLCIIPLPNINWWRVSSPLKLMEYIACGKNILLTDIVAHTNVVEKTSNYFWINKVTPESIAQKIQTAHKSFQDNPSEFYKRGLNEREKHIGMISWANRLSKLEQFLYELRKDVDYPIYRLPPNTG